MAGYATLFEVLGQLAAGMGQRNVLSAQQGVVDQDLQAQEGYNKNIANDYSGLLAQLGKDSPTKATAAARGKYLDALSTALPPGSRGTGEDTNTTQRYGTDQAQEAVADHTGAINMADMMSKLIGPQMMRTDEGMQIGNTNDAVAKLVNFAKGTNASDLVQEGAIHENPYLAVLSGGLEGYGQGLSKKKPGT